MNRRMILLLVILMFSVSLACFAMQQNPQPISQKLMSINMSMIARWLAVYVTVSSLLVNFLAGVELFLKTVEDWANESATVKEEDLVGSGAGLRAFGTRVRGWEGNVSIATDLVDRIGAINWKDKIRPRRWNKRVSDAVAADVAARAAGV